MKESGREDSEMAREFKYGVMVLSTMESGGRGRLMARGGLFI
jgi:hypothetical protein